MAIYYIIFILLYYNIIFWHNALGIVSSVRCGVLVLYMIGLNGVAACSTVCARNTPLAQ